MWIQRWFARWSAANFKVVLPSLRSAGSDGKRRRFFVWLPGAARWVRVSAYVIVAGLVSVLSIETGNFCHVLAATLGLSAILLSSTVAFSIVKYMGAAYLVYLAYAGC
jgi:hypothetical protein